MHLAVCVLFMVHWNVPFFFFFFKRIETQTSNSCICLRNLEQKEFNDMLHELHCSKHDYI